MNCLLLNEIMSLNDINGPSNIGMKVISDFIILLSFCNVSAKHLTFGPCMFDLILIS